MISVKFHDLSWFSKINPRDIPSWMWQKANATTQVIFFAIPIIAPHLHGITTKIHFSKITFLLCKNRNSQFLSCIISSPLCMQISNTMTLWSHSHKQTSILNAFLDFSSTLHPVILFFLHLNPKEDEKHLVEQRNPVFIIPLEEEQSELTWT